jgi:DNA mismatch repair protein MutS
MRQYHRVKRAHRDAILIFRLGDFYEMFYEDAELGAAALELTLTSRNNGKARRVPLAGFPVKAAETYIGRLIAAGYKVAVCEQLEDPKSAKGIVRRDVVEVVTPGALLSEALLDRASGNFLAALALDGERLGMAFADISTGEFWLGEVPLEESAAELERMAPAEVLLPASWCEGLEGGRARLGEVPRSHRALSALCGKEGTAAPRSLAGIPATVRDDGLFHAGAARERLLQHLGAVSLAGFGVPEESPAVSAAGAALAYLCEVQPQGVRSLTSVRWLRQDECLLLDESTLRNLEVFRAFQQDGNRRATLLGAVDATLSSPGARLLRAWLLRPPNRREPVVERQDAVAFLHERGEVRARVREALRRIPDVPRIVGRSVAGRASPRDLGALRQALERLPDLANAVSGGAWAGTESPGSAATAATLAPAGALAPAEPPPLLSRLLRDLEGFEDLRVQLANALVDDPPALLADGGVIRRGHDAELDGLRETRASGQAWIAALQKRERERTGIPSLKVGFNRVFGYFIEVTRPNLAQVPADYARKQTISNGERFVTPELKEMESRVLGAEEKIGAQEAELFARLRDGVASLAAVLQKLGEALAALDVLAAFAETAAERGYCRPEICEEDVLEIRGGRHPVVEANEGLSRFVPNDLLLDGERRIMILTGPNMAGKSTYLRQVGLIALLAHAGAFVPAESAKIGLVDRIFTRVGASDDLSRGRSTFLVEMVETANILRNASTRSLVLLDEVGRGTATFDGLSLAWAVTEWLHAMEGGPPRTIFATHYHELTELAALLPRVFNAHAQVKEWGEEIVFLKKVADGRSDRSYGIQVARLAGIPPSVLERAREILENLESGEFSATGLPLRSRGRSAPRPAPREQITLFEPPPDPLRDALRELDVDALRPIDALNLLAEWKRKYAKDLP